MRTILWGALVALACGGTSGSSTGVTEPAAVQPSAPVPTRGPLATIVVRPDRWPEVSATVATLFGSALPDVQAWLARPETLLSLQSRRWAAAAELPQIDRTRPVVVRLFEPRVHGLATIARTITEDRPTLRHVILVPSERPAELAAALVSLLECPPIAAPTSGPRAGRAHQCDAFVVGFAPRDGELAIAIGDPDADVAPRSAFEADPGDTPLAIELRAEPLRDVGAARGAKAVRDALVSVAPEYAEPMRTAGLAEIAGGYLRTGPWGREIDVLRVAVAPRVGLRFDARLTAEGAARWQSTRSSADSAVSAPAPVHVRTSLPLRALRDATPAPVGYRTLEDERSVAFASSACGVTCVWHALTAPFAHAALRTRHGAPELLSLAIDPTMPVGALDAELDVRRLGESLRARELVELSAHAPTFHLRSRVQGARWVGVLSIDPRVEVGAIDAAAASALESSVVDEGSLGCLERLGRAVSEGLTASVDVAPTERAALLAQVRADATRAAECVRAPSLLAERAEWLALLEHVP